MDQDKVKTMINTSEDQSIIIYTSKRVLFQVIPAAIVTCILGIVFTFSIKWQFPSSLPALGIALFLFSAALFCGPIYCWRIWHHPLLTFNTQGIYYQTLFGGTWFLWEEIGAITCFRRRRDQKKVFFVGFSPAGAVSFMSRQNKPYPSGYDITMPQEAVSFLEFLLAVPVDQLLVQIRERFAVQLERYHIDIDDDC